VETGIIRQLPSGEFIEETRPLDEDRLAKIAMPEQLELPAGAVETADQPVPPPGMRGSIGRVKARLNKIVTETVPMNGHGADGHGANGHGANGHGPDEHDQPAAIGSRERDHGEPTGGSDHHS